MKKTMAIVAGAAMVAAMTATPALAAPLLVLPEYMEYVIKSTTGTDGNSFNGKFVVTKTGTDYNLVSFVGTVGASRYDMTNMGVARSFNRIALGGLAYGPSAPQPMADDFFTGYFTPSDTVVNVNGTYGFNGFEYQWVTYSIIPAALAVAAVPEPATWAMLLVGFGMIGATARYRRRNTAVRYA